MKNLSIILITLFLFSCGKEEDKSKVIVDPINKDTSNVDFKSGLSGVWIETYPNDSGSTIYIGKDTIVGIFNDATKGEIFKAHRYELQNNNSILYSKIELEWNSGIMMDYYTDIIFYKTDSVRIKKYTRSDNNLPRDFGDIVMKKIK